MIKEIIYKGKTYHVVNPGQLQVFNTPGVKNSWKMFDQLDPNLPEVKIHFRVSYLKKNYGLTEQDYYIIVMFEGDETKQPKCPYVNPYTGEKCDKYCRFTSLVPRSNSRKPGIRYNVYNIGCEDYIQNASAQKKQKRVLC